MAYVTGINSLDSLLYGTSWTAFGKPATITYSFMTQAPSYASATDAAGFQPMTAAEQQAVVAAMATWSAVANITFVQVSDAGAGGMIRLGTNAQAATSAAYTYSPGAGAGGDLYLNNQDAQNYSLAPGSYGFQTLVHELGHALGLKHPGDYDAGGNPPPGPYLPAATDNRAYTVMSYNDAADHLQPRGPMMYDVAAVQYLYGANMSSPGGHTYSFSDAQPVERCLWDSGSGNAIDASASRGAVTINLNDGTFSSIGAVDNISIAAGASFQVALGGAGNDTIYVNALNDTVDGGGGRNTVVFSGDRADYVITSVQGAITVKAMANGQAADVLNHVSTLSFADATVDTQTYATVFAAGAAIEGQVARLYTAAFGRAPDAAGLSYWVATDEAWLTQHSDNDITVLYTQIAPNFLGSAEFQTRYGAMDDTAFLTALYQNALGRVPDAPGLQFWLGTMEGPHAETRAMVLVGFSESAECQAKTAAMLALLT